MEASGAAVFGLLAVLGVPAIGLLALVVGVVALARINRSGGALRGRGLAIGAIVIGGLLMLVSLLAIPLLLFLSAGRPAVQVESSKVWTERAKAEEAARRAEEETRKREPEHRAPAPPPPPPMLPEAGQPAKAPDPAR